MAPVMGPVHFDASHTQIFRDNRTVLITSPLQEKSQEKSTLDIAQRFERRLAQYNSSQNIIKRWFFEIMSWVASAICMGAMIGICVHSRDQPLSTFPLALSISNALSKVASAALILPISEAIGQLKWAWFGGSKSKEIVDFEIFDKASRGAWGSFLLLFRTRGKSLAALGAVLTLLLLVTDTFFQQVIDLPERWVIQGYGEIPRVVQYESEIGKLYIDGVPASRLDVYLQQTTEMYFYYNGSSPLAFGNGKRPEIPLSCPSSRCEWDTYDSLGFCSACADVSELLTYACLETKLDWISTVKYNSSHYPTGTSCGYWLNATSDAPMLMSGYRTDQVSNATSEGEALLLRTLSLTAPFNSIFPFSSVPFFNGSVKFQDIYSPVLDALIVSAPDGTASSVYRSVRPVAQECIIAWCVKTFQSSYAEGKYEETVIGTFMNRTARDQPYPREAYLEVSEDSVSVFTQFHGNITIRPPWMKAGSPDYGTSNGTHSKAQALFDDMFPSTITVANSTAVSWWRIAIYAWDYNHLRLGAGCSWLAPNNITKYVERLATSMTNTIRSHTSHDFVRGTAYTQTTFIAVHLEWLIFPLALLCFSLVFLIATMVKTSKATDEEMGMWKTSAMPALLYSLPKDTQRQFRSQGIRKGSLKNRRKSIRIRLHPKQGWRVSGQTLPSPIRENELRAPPGWI